MPPGHLSNKDIAAMFHHIADLLAANDENPFRVRSYRAAALSVSSVRQSLAKIVEERGVDGLTGLKGVGEKLAGLIEEYVKKGTVDLVRDLEKEVPAEKLKAVEAQKSEHTFAKLVILPVATVLEIDEDYRERAKSGTLKMIAPRLLNPDKKAWLPILSRKYKGCKFTVMFSNTTTAHKLDKTNDWVVVYYEKGAGENQCTVVTESRGTLKGKRVIRGREKECAEYYKKM